MKKNKLRLDARWSIGHDELQWIIYRGGGAVSFVSSTKIILLLCLREKGAPEAVIWIADKELPDTFREFING